MSYMNSGYLYDIANGELEVEELSEDSVRDLLLIGLCNQALADTWHNDKEEKAMKLLLYRLEYGL